MNKQQ